jgi:hypothetical protein
MEVMGQRVYTIRGLAGGLFLLLILTGYTNCSATAPGQQPGAKSDSTNQVTSSGNPFSIPQDALVAMTQVVDHNLAFQIRGAAAYSTPSETYTPRFSCVTKSSASTTDDLIYDFTCPDITGDEEFKKSSTSTAFEHLGNLSLLLNGILIGQIQSDYSISISSNNEFQLSGQFDDTVSVPSGTYEFQGQSNDTFTPDNPTAPLDGGSVEVSESLEILKAGVDEANFSVTSNDLHLASCGFDSGSIEFVGNGHDIILTFTACGQATLTDDGTPLGTPNPNLFTNIEETVPSGGQ